MKSDELVITIIKYMRTNENVELFNLQCSSHSFQIIIMKLYQSSFHLKKHWWNGFLSNVLSSIRDFAFNLSLIKTR